MKLIDSKLYLEWGEMVECGCSENTLKKANQRNSNSWEFLQDPDDRRKVLIGYDNLRKEYKDKVQARFGKNPYDYMAKQPIRNLVKYDEKAENFYLAYRYDGEKTLSPEHVRKYTVAASWLNMLIAVNKDKKSLKKHLKLSVEEFYNQVLEIIRIDNIYLPSSKKRLVLKREAYENDGYQVLIDWRFGNTLAAKVKDELCEAVLLEMIAHGNQFDDVFIQIQYNRWAVKNGYKPITAATVGLHRKKKQHLIIMQREGNNNLNEKFIRQVKGSRPSAPLFLVESDDNHLDLLFADPDNPRATPKYIAMVVMDSFNDYVLGYSYALAGSLKDEMSIALVKAAYLNAMRHIREITGGWYLPHEIKTDNWAIKSLQPFYESIGAYIETPVGSKHRGYIEQFFGAPHWKRCMKILGNNYSGNNITRANRGVNIDMLRLNSKNRPLIGNEAVHQIESFFHNLRYMDDGSGKSKHERWMEAWNALPSTDKRQISDEQFLLKFGIKHNANGHGLRITNRGVEPQINGQKYSFDLLTNNKMEYIGKRVSLYYDPFDMSRVLLTDEDSLRIMARAAITIPRAQKDHDSDTDRYLWAVLHEKRESVERIAAAAQNRHRVLAEHAIDAEALLKTGTLVKEIKQAAEQRYLAELLGEQDDENIFTQL